VLASVFGMVGVVYSLFVSAPIEITRQNTMPSQTDETIPELAQGNGSGRVIISAY
jgi:hypothetical protein